MHKFNSELSSWLSGIKPENLLSKATPYRKTKPKCLIVPHAGLKYSGRIAASCYASVKPYAAKYSQVVLLATNHSYNSDLHDAFYISHPSIAIPPPLHKSNQQQIKIVEAGDTELQSVFSKEHSWQIQLPFLNSVFPSIPIYPIIVSKCTTQLVELLEQMDTANTLWILSTDLFHAGQLRELSSLADAYRLRRYGPRFDYQLPADKTIYDIQRNLVSALASNTNAISIIEQYRNSTICGIEVLACWFNMRFVDKYYGKIVAYGDSTTQTDCTKQNRHNNKRNYMRSSHYTLKNRSRKSRSDGNIVGYLGMIMIERGNLRPSSMTDCEATELKGVAYNAILNRDASIIQPRFNIPEYGLRCGVFVTLRTLNGELRGCIGTWSTDNTILDNVVRYARAAAFEDNRFAPLNPVKEHFTIEITILEKRHLVKGNAQEFLNRWRLGMDGVILELDGRTAIFLPSVPLEFGWNKEQTMQQLDEKAGLPTDSWKHPSAKRYLIPGFEV